MLNSVGEGSWGVCLCHDTDEKRQMSCHFAAPVSSHESAGVWQSLVKEEIFEMQLSVSQITTCVVQETLAWFTANARKELSCIQSREKIGARIEKLFIISVSRERSKIYFLSNLWLCQPCQTHGKTSPPLFAWTTAELEQLGKVPRAYYALHQVILTIYQKAGGSCKMKPSQPKGSPVFGLWCLPQGNIFSHDATAYPCCWGVQRYNRHF